MSSLPEQFELRSSEDADRVVVAVRGEVDMFTAQQVNAELVQLVDAGRENIVVDLSGVSFLDSTGLRVLLVAHQQLSSLGGTLVLRGTPPRVARVFQLARVDHIIPSVEPEGR